MKLIFLALDDSSIFVCSSSQELIVSYIQKLHIYFCDTQNQLEMTEQEETSCGNCVQASDNSETVQQLELHRTAPEYSKFTCCVQTLIIIANGEHEHPAVVDTCCKLRKSDRARKNSLYVLQILSEKNAAFMKYINESYNIEQHLQTVYERESSWICEAFNGFVSVVILDAEKLELMTERLISRGFVKAALSLASCVLKRCSCSFTVNLKF